MSVLVYIDHADGAIKKASLEAATYAAKVAKIMGGKEVVALSLGTIANNALAALGNYGVNKVFAVNNALFNDFDSRAFTRVLFEAARNVRAEVIIFSHNSTGKALAPRIAARLKAGLVAGAAGLPRVQGSSLVIRKSVFSGKAFAEYALPTRVKVISVTPNAFKPETIGGTATVSAFNTAVSANDFRVKVLERKTLSSSVPLPEAELVVSGGRGLKGPQNWGMIEELAQELGAATACSRPVADVHWRPHHEHVGQTGVTVSPNLYIAIAISGAIQHLAGVNNSKVIVVINKDPEAPFFKAADYGIVGNAFEVVPKLISAVKAFKAAN